MGRFARLKLRLILPLIAFTGVQLVLFQNCAPTHMEAADAAMATPTATATGAKANFADIQSKIINISCASCHNGSVFDFSSYSSLMASGTVVAGNPQASTFYTDLASGRMPSGGLRVAASDLEAIYNWIQAGALDSAPTVPLAPIGLSAIGISGSSIALTWTDSSDNETGFKLERGLSSGGPFTLIATLSANTSSYSDAGLTMGSIYYYRLSSFNAIGSSAVVSAMASTLTMDAQAPSNLTATSMSSTQINLTWQDNSSSETGFTVERATVMTGPFFPIATLGANAVSYSSAALSAGTTYYYRVFANKSSGGMSAPSNIANATTFGTFTWFNSVISQPKCLSCHSGNAPKGGYNMSTYAQVVSRVVAGNALNSALYQEMASGSMPKGGAKLTAEQLFSVRAWIDSGATNN